MQVAAETSSGHDFRSFLERHLGAIHTISLTGFFVADPSETPLP
jgi:hypothetical protein